MEEITQLDVDVSEQIKDFNHKNLTEEQESLINKLILDEELKQCYKKYGLCKKCEQLKGSDNWCQICDFQQNFKNWTSGNNDVDRLIQKMQLKARESYEILEWIEYDRFEEIEFLAEGGFGTVYKAIWKDGPIFEWDDVNNQWKRHKTYGDHENHPVALKCLHNSQNITAEFLKEVELVNILKKSNNTINNTIIQCYGITKDPTTNNFMMVMEYANRGSLRQYLNNNFNSLNWNNKLFHLSFIAHGLSLIHENGLIHHDFHCGNVLNTVEIAKGKGKVYTYSQITDLGLCKPANATDDKQIYGVLPYVAPEVLKGKEYTQASDIYGFGIISYEVCTGLPPYHDIAHDEFLAINICQGLRPKSNYKIPQLILNLIQRCLDADPLKRPKAKELGDSFWDLYNKSDKNNEWRGYEENHTINEQIKEANEINEKLPILSSIDSTITYNTHAQAVYTSRLLNYKSLPEPKNADNGDNLFATEYSGSIKFDLMNLASD